MKAPHGPTEAAGLLERASLLEPLVASRLGQVRERIAAAGGDPGQITVVAVTKTFPPEFALAALGAGLSDIGENYAGELLEKATALRAAGRRARLHFLGALQRNKLGRLVPAVSCFQGLARPVEAEALARRRPGAEVFVEVNVAEDPARPGCEPARVPSLVERVRTLGLELRGLMAVAPIGGSDEPEAAFSKVADLARQEGLKELSLGMSGDFELAVRAGSTMVRLGTALFGERPPPTARSRH